MAVLQVQTGNLGHPCNNKMEPKLNQSAEGHDENLYGFYVFIQNSNASMVIAAKYIEPGQDRDYFLNCTRYQFVKAIKLKCGLHTGPAIKLWNFIDDELKKLLAIDGKNDI